MKHLFSATPESSGELRESQSTLNVRHVLGGAAAGGSLVFALQTLVGSQPKAVIEMLANFGPMFIVAAGMLLVLDRRMGEFISTSKQASGDLVGAMTQNAAAQQKLADAVGVIAQRDDQRARENELVLSHLARTSNQILEKLNSLEASRG